MTLGLWLSLQQRSILTVGDRDVSVRVLRQRAGSPDRSSSLNKNLILTLNGYRRR